MWRIRLAMFWAVLIAAQSIADLHRANYSTAGWKGLLFSLFCAPSSLWIFVFTSKYPSRYGGAFEFTGKVEEDRSCLERMRQNCPPEEVLVVFALGQPERPETGKIRRDLVYAHLLECDNCTDRCRIVRESVPEPPPAPIIVFR